MKNIGAVLLVIGIIILIVYGFYELLSDLLLPIAVKVGIIALIMGVIIILAALVMEKIKEQRRQ